jgi:hypothetical protein
MGGTGMQYLRKKPGVLLGVTQFSAHGKIDGSDRREYGEASRNPCARADPHRMNKFMLQVMLGR